MDSSESVAGDEGPPAPTIANRLRPSRAVRGPPKIYAIVACEAGMWKGVFEATALSNDWKQPNDGGLVVGLVCAGWALSVVGPATGDAGRDRLRAASFKLARGEELKGYVEYPIVAWAALSQPTAVQNIPAASVMDYIMGHPIKSCSDGRTDASLTVASILQKWAASGATVAAGRAVRIGAGAASRMLQGELSMLHCVAITARLARKRLLNDREPSKRQLADFLKGMGEQETTLASSATVAEAVGHANRGWRSEPYDPDSLLEWLDASSFIKDIHKIGDVAESFARVFSHCSGMPVAKIMSGMRTVHAEILRRSRVRLDCVAMLLFRRLWASTMGTVDERQINLYIFADASPQWRGLEMYASSFDMVDGDIFVHKLFPLVALDKTFQDAMGKCLALLWQVFLMVGPSYAMVNSFLRRVRSLTTDQGVERLLADFPLVLPAFFRLIDPAFKVAKDTGDALLFPRALAVPGWMHLWDLLIRRGLESLDFFPGWLKGLKALVHFLRGTQHCTVIARNLRQRGLDGAADLVEQARLPNFAAWRWGTLRLCCDALAPILASLRESFDPTLFKDSRDRTGIATMLGALKSKDWAGQFFFVHWFCQWVGDIMNWGKGCSCHEDALRRGEDLECPMKGRRLREAYPHAKRELRSGLAEANEWGPQTWNAGGKPIWLACQGCVRLTFEVGMQKLAFLDKLPYVLARLEEPGVRRRCMDQWDSCPPEGHHRVTREFFEGPLRQDIEAMNNDGTGASARLKQEVRSLALIPLDDSIAESPHAIASRLMQSSRGAKWPWVASTLRLKQNLCDAREIPDAVDQSFSHLWRVHTSVLKGPSARARHIRKKVDAKRLQADVYHMKFAHDAVIERPSVGSHEDKARDLGEVDARDEGDGCDSSAVPAKAPHGRKGAKRNRSGRGGDDGVAASNPPMGSGSSRLGAFEFAKRNEHDVRLMRQFLSCVLKPNMIISLPIAAEDGGVFDQFFQVLALETRRVLIKTFRTLEDGDEDTLFNISTQPLERWRPTDEPLGAASSAQDVYIYQDPCTVDVLALCGGLSSRDKLLFWRRQEQSDVDGCLALSLPTKLVDTVDLTSSQAPVASLLDALHQCGFAGCAKKVAHDLKAPKEYDRRQCVSKRAYLQCLLCLQDLVPKVGRFSSGEPDVYYMLLLQEKSPVPPGLGAKKYKELLAKASGDFFEEAMLAAAEKSSTTKLGRSAAASSSAAKAEPDCESNSIASDDGKPPAQVDIEAVQADGSSGDSSVAGDDGVDPSKPTAPPGVFPEELLGQRLRQVSGRRGGKWSYQPRLSIACPNPDHASCSKSRSITMDADKFGPLSGVFFLGAWMQRSELPEKEHRRFVPDRSAIEGFAESYMRG